MSLDKMKKNIFIFFITSSVIIVIGSFLYINSNSEIPTIYPPDGPIRELPKNTPEVKRPSNIPCVYSLWNNSNEPCGSLESIFEERKLNVNYFSLLFGTFSKLEDAEIHLKKLKLQDFLKDRIIKIEKILPTNIVINIKKGDTVSTIARKFSTTSKNIIELNNLTNPDKIRVGQRLLLPGEDLKYRIITTNIENIDMAQNYCNSLLNLNFRCQILSQKD